jgi:hypothetical protein
MLCVRAGTRGGQVDVGYRQIFAYAMLHYPGMPKEHSLHILCAFIEEQNNKHASAPRLKIGCAHITFSVDAADVVAGVQALLVSIIQGKVPVISSTGDRGETCDLWMESSEAKFSGELPGRLVEVARKYFSEHPEPLVI